MLPPDWKRRLAGDDRRPFVPYIVLFAIPLWVVATVWWSIIFARPGMFRDLISLHLIRMGDALVEMFYWLLSAAGFGLVSAVIPAAFAFKVAEFVDRLMNQAK